MSDSSATPGRDRPTWGGLLDRLGGLVEDGLKLLVDPDEPQHEDRQAGEADGPRRDGPVPPQTEPPRADWRVGDRIEVPADLDRLPLGTILRNVRSSEDQDRIAALAGNENLQHRWSSTRTRNTVHSVSLLGWSYAWRIAYLPDGDDR